MMSAATAQQRQLKPLAGLLYNEYDSHRFVMDPPGKMKLERLDQLVDELADSQVTVMLINCNAKKTNFPSKSWEPHSEGFDPAKGEDQWAHNLKTMLDQGVDPTGRMLDRCRQRGISPWVSMRMNDVHDAGNLKSRLHSKFWLEHPEYWRYPDRFKAWNDRCLNYGLKPVRDYAMSLVKEVLGRYDLDGFELDWNRFPLHFREGEEQQGAKLLTEWMADVRQVAFAAEKRLGHPITLAARVPALPEVSLGTGLDAVTWARRGLIDHLIVAPFWATTDFDIPVERWAELLKGTGVGVTAGLEIRIQPCPGGPTLANTPERRRGAARAMLARGSQGVYLFNYFDMGSAHPDLLREMGSLETLKGKNRSYVVTYRDIQVPGKPLPAPLPKALAPGESADFQLFVGPVPAEGASGEISLGLEGEHPTVTVTINGKPTNVADEAARFAFARGAFADGYNTVRVANAGAQAVTVNLVELLVRFGSR